jgi:hypothetical protein
MAWRATGQDPRPPPAHIGWYRWVLHLKEGSDDLPWRYVCHKCASVAIEETHHPDKGDACHIDTTGITIRFWRCDRCARRRPWRKGIEIYPTYTQDLQDRLDAGGFIPLEEALGMVEEND